MSTLISVDIQPEYQNSFGFQPEDFAKFVTSRSTKTVFLFNGPEVGGPDEQEYKYWWYENGLSEEEIDYATWYDKGYAFFRFCMDEGVDTEAIAEFVKFLYQNDITDSRDMDADKWADFMAEENTDAQTLRELMEHSDEMISIPPLMEFLSGIHDKIILTGGGVEECLKEVEIALIALDKPYTILHDFTF